VRFPPATHLTSSLTRRMFPMDSRMRWGVRVYSFSATDCAALPAVPPVGTPDGMRFLLDDAGVPVREVNLWLRSLPTTGAPGPKTWAGFLRERSLDAIDDPSALKDALAAYHGDRRMGRLDRRLGPSSWNRAMASISSFYEWAESEGLISQVPFSYRTTVVRARDGRATLSAATWPRNARASGMRPCAGWNRTISTCCVIRRFRTRVPVECGQSFRPKADRGTTRGTSLTVGDGCVWRSPPGLRIGRWGRWIDGQLALVYAGRGGPGCRHGRG
jgi:hypothetical protein